MKILITGCRGQLGRCLQDRCAAAELEAVTTDVDELDITRFSAVEQFVAKHSVDCIVNAAAYTAVDRAESEPELAYAVNVLGPENLARVAKQADIPLFHISTDYVFDGCAVTPYRPTDPVNPQGVYGETKLAGESTVVAVWPKHIILRTAWVFSEYGNNFVKTMLRLGRERKELSVVADQYGCPTYAGDLADAILALIHQYRQAPDQFAGYGLYHFCGQESTSWHGFARAILTLAQADGLLKELPKIQAIATEQYPTPAKRPAYSVLSSTRPDPLSGVNRNWQLSLNHVLKNLR
jgi:dTDP-4-dehydrorhamnose reductase